MLRPLDQKHMDCLKKCWEVTKGEAWEPKGGVRSKPMKVFVDSGYLEIVDGRCMFERIKDAMVSWTDEGRKAMESL